MRKEVNSLLLWLLKGKNAVFMTVDFFYIINTELPFFTACLGMDITGFNYIIALNGTTVKIPCIFTSCYKIDVTHFSMNWTYQESLNGSEQKVKQKL